MSIDENDDAVPDAVNRESELTVEMIGDFPREMAMLLIGVGLVVELIPGVPGVVLVIVGGMALWPKTFKPIEKWFCHRFPGTHRQGVIEVNVLLDNLRRRFPED